MDELVQRWRAVGRLLFVGAPGTGKSTLVTALADRVEGARVLHADPGQPAFGPPGAVALAARRGGGWDVRAVEGLGTLDALRFRLPLVEAVARLAAFEGPLLVDAPGVIRGGPSEELLSALARVTGARAVVVLSAKGEVPAALAHLEVIHRAPDALARPGSDAARVRRRTAAWDAALAGAVPLELAGVRVLGAPPREEAAWRGRQAVLLGADGATLALGEIEARDGERLRLRCPPVGAPVTAVVVRDAQRDARGALRSAPRPGAPKPPPGPVEGTGTRGVPLPTRRGGRRARPVLMNGLFGDPMLHLRLARGRRSLLVDAGACADLPSRIAHQVTDVFATHAHMDHFAGLAWLLRRRVHTPAPCRVVGPPGTAARVAALCDAFTWDRVGRDGPRFLVGDFEGDVVRWSEVRAGRALPEPADVTTAPGGCVLAEEDVRVRAVSLDHGTRVLAWRYEDRGQVVVYATDLADTPENRAALVDLARGADVLVLEAHFTAADAERARATKHLTTRACAEIAREADVALLVPFHFSVRYEGEVEGVYAEIAAVFPRIFDLRR